MTKAQLRIKAESALRLIRDRAQDILDGKLKQGTCTVVEPIYRMAISGLKSIKEEEEVVDENDDENVV